MRCNPNKDIVQLTVNQRQRKREMAATLVFVFTGHWNLRFNSKQLVCSCVICDVIK